ncbi:hypothetical protein NEHOM01_0876 [Nematocida homosporus]|uniref:uncharacterized protein n=1 Tax=Nematocida homosporus TaxID=1912981 RepID=UPI00221FA985|nr:uncharacterized protein NEHOM01_0876 [Nematocida homosporus]KAI5185517.1 hypothetical protein NEHOM01_0876 [Nematocida homosporus]
MDIVWSTVTGTQLHCKKESVATFLERHSLSLSTHAVVQITWSGTRLVGQRTLELDGLLGRVENAKTLRYLLVQPEHQLTICLNSYTREFLLADLNQLTFSCAKQTPISQVLRDLRHYFSPDLVESHFTLYTVESTALGRTLVEVKLGSVAETYTNLQLQARDPFLLARTRQPQYVQSFYQLDTFNSSLLFATQYAISLYSHFILAQKKGGPDKYGQSLEITEDLRAFKQVFGKRHFLVIETPGTRWTFYSKSRPNTDQLLYEIKQAPRYKPREIEPSKSNKIQRYCQSIETLLAKNNPSLSSLPLFSRIFPSELPTDQMAQDPVQLLHKLESYLQRSVWDNVNIEFILYLLVAQNILPIDGLQDEVRQFSTHRKQILSQLRDFLHRQQSNRH